MLSHPPQSGRLLSSASIRVGLARCDVTASRRAVSQTAYLTRYGERLTVGCADCEELAEHPVMRARACPG